MRSIYILGLFLFLSCSDSKSESENKIKFIKEVLSKQSEIKSVELELKKINNFYKYYQLGDTVSFSGVETILYSNFHIKSIRYYKNGEIDSISKEFYDNGQLMSQGYFEDSKRVGLWKEWHANGKLHSSINYKSDKKMGEAQRFYESGNIASKAFYINDQLDSIFESWYENGQKMCETNFEEGVEQEGGKYWNVDGDTLDIEKQDIDEDILIVDI